MSKALAMLNLSTYHTIESLTSDLDFWYYYLDGHVKNPDVRKLMTQHHARPDAVLDCWYALLAPEIIKAYPDTKFILTTRETEGWLKSYQKYVAGSSLYYWQRQARRLIIGKMSRMLSLGPILRAMGVIPASDGLDLEKLPHLMRVWELSDFVMYGNSDPKSHPLWYQAQDRHTSYIRSIVPPEQLFEFDLSKNHGWAEIVEFLDLPRDDPIVAQRLSEPYPKVFASNKVKSAGMSQRSKEGTALHEAVTVAVWIVILTFIVAQVYLTSRTRTNGSANVVKTSTRLSRLSEMAKDFYTRCKIWLRLVGEYPVMCENYAILEKNGYFEYGSPGSFSNLDSHIAMKTVLNSRCPHVFHSTLKFIDDESVLPTYLPVEKGAAAALGALGLACADLFELRTGEGQDITICRSDAGLATVASMFFKASDSGKRGSSSSSTRNGFCERVARTVTSVAPTCQAYPCADGRSVFLNSGYSPEMKTEILDFFGGVPDTVEAMRKAVAEWKDAEELESAMHAKGLAVSVCRNPMEWRRWCSPTEQFVINFSPVEVKVRFKDSGGASKAGHARSKSGTSRSAEMFVANKSVAVAAVSPGISPDNVRVLCTGPSVTKPLSDVLVLDFSQLAGSHTVGRSLVDHGATVIQVIFDGTAGEKRSEEEVVANAGKTILELDITSKAGKARFWKLLAVADALIDGRTDDILEKNGFRIEHVLTKCPQLVYLEVSCFDSSHRIFAELKNGPEDMANLCAGLTGQDDVKLVGHQLTSQTAVTTGFLGAYAIVTALCQRQLSAVRHEQIQGVHARVSLCDTATWTSQFGAEVPGVGEYIQRVSRLIWGFRGRRVETEHTAFLPPPIQMSMTQPERVAGGS